MTVCLWREAAIFNVAVGDILTASHLKTANPDYGVRMQSTSFTKMQVFIYRLLVNECDVYAMDLTVIKKTYETNIFFISIYSECTYEGVVSLTSYGDL